MPIEIQSKPKEQSEPDPSPNSEKPPSDQVSPTDDKTKEESDKSVPETPEDQPPPDDPRGTQERVQDPRRGSPSPPPRDVVIRGTDIMIPPHLQYHYDTFSSDDDDEDEYDLEPSEDVTSYDETWIECYSAESNPRWTAVRDACETVLENARLAVAHIDWHAKTSGVQLDTKRLERVTSQLTALGEDLGELAASTAPLTIPSGSEVGSVMALVSRLAEMAPGEGITREALLGKINGPNLGSLYRAYKTQRKQALSEVASAQLNVFQCLNVWEKYRGAFIGYCRETKVLEQTEGAWTGFRMSLQYLETWNREMRYLMEVALRLLDNVQGIVEPLMIQLDEYLEAKKCAKSEMAQLLAMGAPDAFRDVIMVY